MVDCPACGNASGSIYLAGCRDLLCGVDGEWSIQECFCCGLLFTVPRSDEAQAATFYPKHYPAYHPEKGVKPSSSFLFSSGRPACHTKSASGRLGFALSRLGTNDFWMWGAGQERCSGI